MKKTKFTLFSILLLLIFSSNSIAQASQQNQFGYVNITEVMQLHPTMRYFDSSTKRFELAALIKGKEAEKRAEENKVKAREEINKLENKIKEVEAKRKELEETYLERLEHISVPDEKLLKMSAKEKSAYEKKKAEIEAKFCDEADEIRKELYFLNEKMINQQNNSNYNGFLTVGETSQVFTLMLDDVYEAINHVSKSKNIPFVFNSSANIVFNETPMSSPNKMAEFLDNFKETLKNPEGKIIAGAALAQWLRDKNSTFTNCIDRRISSFVIVGGSDLTPDVIDYIYEKYKIGIEQREFIKEYFKKIVNVNN